ncbi:hypothetical protein ACOKFD_01480 [Flagellimonas sp. S174]|uniref:hypothetical protein n=1 Tax=Flagellimonas sp. S174 TaxID=3410790 RepID=UPI003BF4B1BB
MIEVQIIAGNTYSDNRGELTFFNTLNLDQVKRFYHIAPNSTETIRAWQGHLKENKWFYCTAGAFILNLVEVDNFDNPSKELPVKHMILDSSNPKIIHVPGGYASGFKSIYENSKLMVFSNFTLEDSKGDDFRYPLDTWFVNW